MGALDEVLARFGTAGASPTPATEWPSVSPQRDPGALHTPAGGRPDLDRRDEPATEAASAFTANDPAPPPEVTRPAAPAVEVGALVAWAHAGRWQYGLAQGVSSRDRRAFVRPLDDLRRCLPKPLEDLVFISSAAALLQSVVAAHASLERP